LLLVVQMLRPTSRAREFSSSEYSRLSALSSPATGPAVDLAAEKRSSIASSLSPMPAQLLGKIRTMNLSRTAVSR